MTRQAWALHIEDNVMTARAIARSLRFDGLRVRIASTQAEGRAAIRQSPSPSVVIADCVLPGGGRRGGLELLELAAAGPL